MHICTTACIMACMDVICAYFECHPHRHRRRVLDRRLLQLVAAVHSHPGTPVAPRPVGEPGCPQITQQPCPLSQLGSRWVTSKNVR